MDGSSSGTTLVVLRALARAGLDPDAELAAFGPSRKAGGISREMYRALWCRVAAARPGLALTVAEELNAGSLGLPEFAAMTAPTLRCGLDVLANLGGLLYADGEYALSEGTNVASFEFEEPDAVPAVLEWSFSYLARRIREVSGATPIEVHFGCDQPPKDEGLKRAFGCSLRFRTEVHRLVFAREDLARMLPTSDPETHEVLLETGRRRLMRLRAEGLVDRARQLIAESLHREAMPRVLEVARRCGTSARALQRTLATEGTSFRALLRSARMEQAALWLRTSERSLTEIALCLRYAELSAFSRAFRLHAGVSPSVYRRQNRHLASCRPIAG
ncbi:MAG: AraC family transcriptional regulator ligand-binding domain-containing protein [Myxococcota bacterium]